MSTSPKRLYRSRTNRILAGVCGGIAEYLDIDPTLLRVIWVVFTIFGGWGLILYIAAVIIMPLNPSTSPVSSTKTTDRAALTLIGLVFVVVGFFMLFINLDLFSFREATRFVWNYLLPVSLIAAGMYLLMRREPTAFQPAPPPSIEPQPPAQEAVRGKKKSRAAKQSAAETPPSTSEAQSTTAPQRRLFRSSTDRKLFGVCGGLGEYFAIDPTIIRIIFVIFTLMSLGFGVLLYIALLFLMPEPPRPATT
jgi:phage shock protein C